MGCTLNCDPSWLSVFSPRIASITTRALNFGLYCFLVVVIDLSFVNDSAENLSLLPGLKSWDHYSLRSSPGSLRSQAAGPVTASQGGLDQQTQSSNINTH